MADVIACPDCAAIQRLPDLRRGGLVECRRCGSPLERSNGRSLDAALACAIATLLLLFPANLLPLMSVSFLGTEHASRLGAGVVVMWQQHFMLIALVVAAQAVVLPFFRFGLLASVLAALRFGRPEAWIGTAFRWSERLDVWAMPDVFLIGLFVGYGRVRHSLPVHIGDGGWCLIGAAFLTMVTRASLDRRTIWRRIGAPQAVPPTGLACTSCDLVTDQHEPGTRCPRCRARLWPRKPFSIMRTAALLATGYLLYPVANIYPMSIAVQLGSPKPHTIFDGVQAAHRRGPLAAGGDHLHDEHRHSAAETGRPHLALHLRAAEIALGAAHQDARCTGSSMRSAAGPTSISTRSSCSCR